MPQPLACLIDHCRLGRRVYPRRIFNYPSTVKMEFIESSTLAKGLLE